MRRNPARNGHSLAAIASIALLSLLLATPAVLAGPHGPGGCPRHHGRPGPGPGMGPGPGPGMGPGPGGWWRNPRTRQALGLTDDQVRKIEETWYESATADADLRAAAEKAHIELARLLHADRLDEKALAEAIDRVTEADAALARSRLERRVAIAKVLTPEQRRKLEDLMRRRNRPGRGRRGHGPGGRGPGMGRMQPGGPGGPPSP